MNLLLFEVSILHFNSHYFSFLLHSAYQSLDTINFSCRKVNKKTRSYIIIIFKKEVLRRLLLWCFLKNFAKFFRTDVLKNTSGRLLLSGFIPSFSLSLSCLDKTKGHTHLNKPAAFSCMFKYLCSFTTSRY